MKLLHSLCDFTNNIFLRDKFYWIIFLTSIHLGQGKERLSYFGYLISSRLAMSFEWFIRGCHSYMLQFISSINCHFFLWLRATSTIIDLSNINLHSLCGCLNCRVISLSIDWCHVMPLTCYNLFNSYSTTLNVVGRCPLNCTTPVHEKINLSSRIYCGH